jgi:hypothetical protein
MKLKLKIKKVYCPPNIVEGESLLGVRQHFKKDSNAKDLLKRVKVRSFFFFFFFLVKFNLQLSSHMSCGFK